MRRSRTATGTGIAALAIIAIVVAAFIAVRLTRPDGAAQPGSPVAVVQPPAAADLLPTPSVAGSSGSPSPGASGRSAIPATTPLKPGKPAGPASPATSRRKGVGVWTFNGISAALADSGASWYYTWSAGHSGVSTPKGVEFVPMIWGPASVTTSNLAEAKAAGHDLLGFNEPDMSSQSNMTVKQALDLWPKLQATGLTLGSPAVAYGGATAGGWLDQFMTGAKQRGYRVDFITLHWYGSDFRTAAAVGQLKSYVQAVWNRYHKPIWLTEFALIKFSDGSQFPTEAQQAAFVTASTKMLDGLAYLQRYAWFGLGADDHKPSSGLYRSGPRATAAGTAFEAAQ